MERWEFEQILVRKALKDPTFKKKMLTNPKEAVKEAALELKQNEINITSLEKMNIKVVKEQKDEWIIAMPDFSEETDALQEGDLEQLAAGDAWPTCPGTVG